MKSLRQSAFVHSERGDPIALIWPRVLREMSEVLLWVCCEFG